jgi:hypothetical protein
MKLTTKQLKRIIKEELKSLLNESEEAQQMAELISGVDIQSVKSGLRQIILTGMPDLLGIRLVDVIDDPSVNYHLKVLKGWTERILLLYKRYHSKDLDPAKLERDDIEDYADDIKVIIETFWYTLSPSGFGINPDSILPEDISKTTQTWTSSFAGDVLLQISDGKEIFGSDYYGFPARTPKPGENVFATAYNSTGEWLAKIMPMMEQNEILSQLLEELT